VDQPAASLKSSSAVLEPVGVVMPQTQILMPSTSFLILAAEALLCDHSTIWGDALLPGGSRPGPAWRDQRRPWTKRPLIQRVVS
jgi:hypothetical protein